LRFCNRIPDRCFAASEMTAEGSEKGSAGHDGEAAPRPARAALPAVRRLLC
jgi:hypothetical protein